MSKTGVIGGHYDSVQDYCNIQPSATNAAMWDEKDDSNRKWRFGDAKDAITLRMRINSGWEAGARRVQELMAGEVGAPVSVRRHRVRSDQGDSLDIHHVLRGDLSRAWERTRRDKRPSPSVIRIVAMVTGACGDDSSTFFYRGAAVARLTDMLTQAGYSVEVVAAMAASSIGAGYGDDDTDYCSTITLKHSTAPLDLSQLAAVLCQEGFVRYFMCKAMTAWNRRVGSHFGYVYEDKLAALVKNAVTEDNVRTLTIGYRISDAYRAKQWIEEAVRTIDGLND